VPPARNLTLAEIVDLQRAGCSQLGSHLYAEVLTGILADLAAGGVCDDILTPHAADAWTTALPLRFLGAVHRLVLEGRAPVLAAHYPSAGGAPGPGLVGDFLSTVREHRAAVEEGLGQGVQTNEVGRSAALVGGSALAARRSGLPLRVFEVGASAGLNLRFDHFWYDTGVTTFGDPASAVRFEGVWRAGGEAGRDASEGHDFPGSEQAVLPELEPVIAIEERAGCDRNPLDPLSEEGRTTLRSFLWPDQVFRRSRLDAALAIAARVPARVDDRDLGAWLEDRLTDRPAGVTTVVYHSIVWQYVAPASRDRMRAALRRAGVATTAARPIAWLRLEPAGPVADLRLTWWPGGEEETLGVAGYHGEPVYWGVTPPPAE
jgi:hypothetical protein